MTGTGESDLLRDVALTAEVKYRPSTGRATLRVLNGASPLMINSGGGLDGDPDTITTQLTGPGFDVDRFGILLWEDTNAGGTTWMAIGAPAN